MIVAAVINLKQYRTAPLTLIPHLGPFKIWDTVTIDPKGIDPKSFLSGEGIFGIEYYQSKNLHKIQLFSSDKEGVSGTKVRPAVIFSTKKDDLKNINIYHIASKKPSMFPFSFSESSTLWGDLRDVLSKTIEDQKVFIQLLAQRQDSNKWIETLQSDYELYLRGVKEPSNTFVFRKLQEKMVDLTEKQDGWKTTNPEIKEFHQKIDEDGFRVVVRLAIHGGDQKKNGKLVKSIMSCFKVSNNLNQWDCNEVFTGKKNYIENLQMRRMPILHGRTQYLCESELLPLFYIENTDHIQPKAPETVLTEPVKPRAMQTGSLVDLLPYGDSIEKKEDSAKIEEQLNVAMKKVGLIKSYGLKIQKLQNGCTLRKITFNIPEGVKLSQIENHKKDIQAELGLKNIAIEQGEAAGTAAILIPQEKRTKVYLRNLMDNEEFKKFCSENELPFVIGVNEIGEAIYECLARIKHVLVAGTTGSGKSVWLSQFILTLSITKRPEEMRFYMIDPKQVELPIFNQLPHTIEVISDLNKSLSLLNQLVNEMKKRYEVFAKSQCRNIKQYNQKHQRKMDYIVVIIDEFAGLVMPCPDVKDPIIMLAQMARACGIHLVICTQRPEVEIIDGLIKANIPSRIGFKCNSVHDYKTFLDQKPPTLLGGGDGVAELEGFMGLKRFQGPVIANGDEETDEVINHIARAWNGKEVAVKHQLPDAEETIEEESEEEIVDDLTKIKCIIAETGETRNRQLQDQLGIRRERVTELLHKLVDEGWLEKSTKGYKVIVPDEIRNQYLSTT